MSRLKKFVIIFSLHLPLLSLSIQIAAEESNLSKAQIVQLAFENNRYLAAAQLAHEQALARSELSGKWANPEITFDYSTDWLFNDEGESSFGIAFEQRFPIAKRLSLQKEIAAIEIELAEAEMRDFKRKLVRDLELALNDLAYIESQLELRKSLAALNSQFAEFVASRVETAEASTLDANQVKLELYVNEQEIQNLNNQYASRLAQLRSLIGLEPDATLTLDKTFRQLGKNPELRKTSIEDLSTLPEFQIKSLLIAIADTKTKLALRSRWEDVTIGLGFENERSVDEPSGLGSDRFLGVSVSIPLPARNHYDPIVKQNLTKQAQLQAEIEALSIELRNNLESLREQALNLYLQASHYETNITQLVEQNLQELNAAYSAGLISLNELFRSQEQRLKIQSAYLTMVHDYQQALVEWRAATATNFE